MNATRLGGTGGSWVRVVRAIWVGGLASLLSLGAAIAPPAARAGPTVPPGFVDETIVTGLDQPTSLAFAPNGEMFVAEKDGSILHFDDPPSSSQPVVDLGTQVYSAGDRGLLGMTLDPAFPDEPYLYALFTHDAPIGGTAPLWNDHCPTPPGPAIDGCPVSGRLMRFMLTPDSEGSWTPAGEDALLDGWCQQFGSHSIGDLAFGPDGELYVSGGEGAQWSFADYGQRGGSVGSPVPKNPCGDPPAEVGEDLVVPTSQGGSLRSQSPRRPAGEPVVLNGTVARVDPDTGQALPDNPWATHADTNAQRIVGYGLRNPYRFAIRPGTDELWVGDVGGGRTEEIDVIPDASAGPVPNFGWPCYDAALQRGTFNTMNTCLQLYADTENPMRPARYAYSHDAKLTAGEACPTGGSALSGLTFYEGGTYPAEYDGALFFTDYARNCIWALMPGADGLPDPTNVRHILHDPMAFPVDLEIGPGGDIFYPNIADGTIHRLEFRGSQPTAIATADHTHGAAPLTVQLDGTSSSDPDPDDTLEYSWDLDGDGSFGDAATPTVIRTYEDPVDVTVRLLVTDSRGQSDLSDPLAISVGNTPPVPQIEEPTDLTGWAVGDEITFSGTATDAEDGELAPASLSWRLIQEHCPSTCHPHDAGEWEGAGDSFVAPDHEYPSHLELRLTATDARGLSATTTVDLIPATTTVRFETEPPGLELAVNAETGITPFERTVIVGSSSSATAPSPQTVGGTELGFASWSDGLPQTHAVVAPPEGLTVGAAYEPTGPIVFSDDFETADLSRWTSARGFTTAPDTSGGAWAARATGARSPAEASFQLPASRSELYYQARFKLLNQGTTAISLLGFRTASGSPVASLGVNAKGRLQLYSGILGTTLTSTTAVPKNAWHQVELRIKIDGALGQSEVWLNGTRIASLSRTLALGTMPLGQVRLGDGSSARTFDVLFDDVVTSTSRVVPASALEFSDDFETGGLTKWTSSRGVAVQSTEKWRGTFAARATAAGGSAYLHRTFSQTYGELFARTRFKMLTQGPTSATLMVFRGPGGAAIVSVSRAANGTLTVWNNVTGKLLGSTRSVSTQAWHDLELRARIAGTTSQVEVWLDGARVDSLSTTLSLGTAQIGQLRVGESAAGRSFDLVVDDVEVSRTFLPV